MLGGIFSSSAKTSNKTTTTTDSFNSYLTESVVFDNAGNVYFNSPEPGTGGSGGGVDWLPLALVAVGVWLVWKG